MVNIIFGLLCVMIANILLGSSIAKLKKEWNREKFIEGIFKMIFILLGCILMYICSCLNPNILVVNLDGNNLNLIDGMNTLFESGIVLYGFKDIIKLKDILSVKTKINELEQIKTILEVDNEIEI